MRCCALFTDFNKTTTCYSALTILGLQIAGDSVFIDKDMIRIGTFFLIISIFTWRLLLMAPALSDTVDIYTHMIVCANTRTVSLQTASFSRQFNNIPGII